MDCVVIIATSFGLDGPGFEFRQGSEVFLSSKTVEIGSGATRRPVQWVLGFIHGVNRPRREANHSSPSSAEVKNEWRYTSVPPYSRMGMAQATLTLRSNLGK